MSDECVICQAEGSEDVTVVWLLEPDVHVCFQDMLWTWTLRRDPADTWHACTYAYIPPLVLKNQGEQS